MTTAEQPKRFAALHVADVWERLGGLHDGTPGCDCGRCVAESLRRQLRRPPIRVANGTTVMGKSCTT